MLSEVVLARRRLLGDRDDFRAIVRFRGFWVEVLGRNCISDESDFQGAF